MRNTKLPFIGKPELKDKYMERKKADVYKSIGVITRGREECFFKVDGKAEAEAQTIREGGSTWGYESHSQTEGGGPMQYMRAE